MKKLSISEARGKLPQLARMLVRERSSVAYISHRDLDDDLALTTRSHIEHLERTIDALRKQAPKKPFKLIGSAKIVGTPEELDAWLEENRAEQARLREEKMRRLFE